MKGLTVSPYCIFNLLHQKHKCVRDDEVEIKIKFMSKITWSNGEVFHGGVFRYKIFFEIKVSKNIKKNAEGANPCIKRVFTDQ